MTSAPDRLAEYERVWGNLLALLKRRLAEDERSLARVLRSTEAEWRRMDVEPADGIAYGRAVRLPRSALYAAKQALLIRAVAAQCRPDTGLVVELGSGWGQNLADLYLAGGPRRAAYRGLELTPTGRECTRLLAGLEPDLDLDALAFDYRAPDYGGLPRGNGHAVVFSYHSIEQIAELREDVVTGLLDLGATVTGVHFEPIGWQVEGHRPELGATEAYAGLQHYNRNFLALLKTLDGRGTITLSEVVPDIIHFKPFNASTMVVWHAGGPR